MPFTMKSGAEVPGAEKQNSARAASKRSIGRGGVVYAGNKKMRASGLQLSGCGWTEVLQHEVRIVEKYDGT